MHRIETKGSKKAEKKEKGQVTTMTMTLVSSSLLNLYNNEVTGALGWFVDGGYDTISASNFQELYTESLPLLLPLLVRSIIPEVLNGDEGGNRGNGGGGDLTKVVIKATGPGASSLCLSLLSLPTRGGGGGSGEGEVEGNKVRLPGGCYLDSVHVTDSAVLGVLPVVNVLSGGNFKESSTEVIITAFKGEGGRDVISLDKSIADGMKLTVLKGGRQQGKKEITFVLGEVGGGGAVDCTFVIPMEMVGYRDAAELTLHPVSCGGCYYELKLGKKPVQMSLESLQVELEEEEGAGGAEENYYVVTSFISPKPEFTAGKILKVIQARVENGPTPEGVGDCVVM
ncbi:hypothetical protein TrST_g10900 [Triparma strigata]|uniref:Uncharacterized protein n=1 Tax=Triparma strigata TaxID=1606541 RepID=A0A9W7EC97_9STRA|nr:hypothetical protein TrST_g10900 [Triparma strigata]